MYGEWMTTWGCLIVILSVVIVVLSFYESQRSYRIARMCFITLAVGSALLNVLPWFFGISMADAFGPSPISWLAWIAPVVLVLWYLIPAVALTPVVSVGRARKLVMILAGIQLAYLFLPLVIGLAKGRVGHFFGGYHAIMTIYFLLLWLRVHELRLKADRISDSASA
jgi:hypothetical protein